MSVVGDDADAVEIDGEFECEDDLGECNVECDGGGYECEGGHAGGGGGVVVVCVVEEVVDVFGGWGVGHGGRGGYQKWGASGENGSRMSQIASDFFCGFRMKA